MIWNISPLLAYCEEIPQLPVDYPTKSDIGQGKLLIYLVTLSMTPSRPSDYNDIEQNRRAI